MFTNPKIEYNITHQFLGEYIMRKILLLLLAFTLYTVSSQAQTSNQYQLSTHILDVNSGKPARGVSVKLFKYDEQNQSWQKIAENITDNNGRIANFLPKNKDNKGIYKLIFETKHYFSSQNMPSIYPFVDVVFQIDGSNHYHIPLTMSANGYATYRGN